MAQLEIEVPYQFIGITASDGHLIAQYEENERSAGTYHEGGVAVSKELETAVKPRIGVLSIGELVAALHVDMGEHDRPRETHGRCLLHRQEPSTRRSMMRKATEQLSLYSFAAIFKSVYFHWK